MAARKKKSPTVEVIHREPVPSAAEKLAAAHSMMVAYNVRAAVGIQFNPKLLEDAQKVLASAFSDYAEAIIAEVRRKP